MLTQIFDEASERGYAITPAGMAFWAGTGPVGKVCNIAPPRQIPPTKEEQWEVLREAKRMEYVPGIRINYRKFGVDEDTKRALREL